VRRVYIIVDVTESSQPKYYCHRYWWSLVKENARFYAREWCAKSTITKNSTGSFSGRTIQIVPYNLILEEESFKNE